MNTKKYRGFSLIELMIAISIIGILSSIALPSYKQYLQRARFTDVIAQTEAFKLAVSLAIQEGIDVNEINNGQQGVPMSISNKHIKHITVQNAVISAESTNIAGSATYVLTPNENGNLWEISGSCVTANLCKV